jgi:lysophospholipase L1-like esterase
VTRRKRRVVLGGSIVVGVVVGFVAVLAVEITVAGNGVHLEEYDPHLSNGLVNASGADAGRPPLRITWLGDSTAAGVGSSGPQRAVSHQVAERLGRPVDLDVLAISGARIQDVLEKQVAKVAADTDLVVISVGANDTTHVTSSGDFRERYRAVMDALPKGVPVVIIGVPDVGSTTRLAQPLRLVAGTRADQLGAIVRDIAQERDAAYVNLAANTGPAFRADPDRLFAADHYHPSDAGYGLWAEVVTPVVQWALARAEHPDQPAPPIPKESQ